MKRIGQVALVCAAMVVGGCATGQDAPSTTTAAPSTTASTPSTTTATPTTLTDGTTAERTYTMTFAAEGEVCMDSSPVGCIEPVGADSIRITSSIPDGWSQTPIGGLWSAENAPPGGAGLSFGLGAWLYSDPCHSTPPPDVPVGLTVDDFANALADHPLLEVTTPADVTLAGYSGKYLDLQVPTDITDCEDYWPWEPGIRAQGPGHRWHLWILDVDGVRVVVQGTDYVGTSTEVQAELEAIVDSIQIEP